MVDDLPVHRVTHFNHRGRNMRMPAQRSVGECTRVVHGSHAAAWVNLEFGRPEQLSGGVANSLSLRGMNRRDPEAERVGERLCGAV